MGLFDIFKSKKTISATPENELERHLFEGMANSSAQKEFYQKLLWNNLYLLTMDQYGTEVDDQNPENVTIRTATFEGGQVPIFTSINRIFDKDIIKKEETNYIGIRGQDLFDRLRGATFVLNPYSETWKELKADQIEDLLNGSIFDKIDAYAVEKKHLDRFNQLFEEACNRQEGLIYLDRLNLKKSTPAETLTLEKSILDFQRCLEIVPDHWQSMFMMAKALQRLERHVESLEQLEAAFNIELENHLIPMEASTEAMHLKQLDKALFYSSESMKRNPNNSALMGNHAMNLLIAHSDMEALTTIENALKLEPNDHINKNIASIIQEVIAGKRERPTFEESVT